MKIHIPLALALAVVLLAPAAFCQTASSTPRTHRTTATPFGSATTPTPPPEAATPIPWTLDPAHAPEITAEARAAYDPATALDPDAAKKISRIRGSIRFPNPPPQGYKIVCLFMNHVANADPQQQQPSYTRGLILAKDATGPAADFDFTTLATGTTLTSYSDWAVCITIGGQIVTIRASSQDLVKQITDHPALAAPAAPAIPAAH